MDNTNIWANGFKEPTSEFPEKVVADIIAPFENITENLACLNLIMLDQYTRISSHLDDNQFQFSLNLASKELRSYSFELFRFGYGVSLYPVSLLVQEDIGAELKLRKAIWGSPAKCSTETEFKVLVIGILQSQKFKDTVGGLIKVAKRIIDETPP